MDRSPGVTTYTPLMTTFVGADGESYTVVQLVSDTPSVNIHAPMFSYGIKNYGTENEERVLHVFGTDKDGRDVLVRLMCGGRISLTVSFLTVVLIAVFGIIMGGLAGYSESGWICLSCVSWISSTAFRHCRYCSYSAAILDAYAETYDFLRTYRIYIMMGFLTLISWTAPPDWSGDRFSFCASRNTWWRRTRSACRRHGNFPVISSSTSCRS